MPIIPFSGATPGDGAAAFGPCQPWDPIWCHELPTGSEAVSGYALEMATEILWNKTGQRYGTCTHTIRPCRQSCWSNGVWPYNDSWSELGVWPRPVLFDGEWFNIACGTCGDGCSCNRLDEIELPGPVASIQQVKVDGVTLVQGVDYRLDDYRKLVRLNNLWPMCNDLNKADTQEGTWSVTATWGIEVPKAGQFAVGELAYHIILACMGDAGCALPMTVQRLARQGVTIDFLDPQRVFDSNRIGLTLCDMFISAVNPDNLRSQSRVYNLDQPSYRIAGT